MHPFTWWASIHLNNFWNDEGEEIIQLPQKKVKIVGRSPKNRGRFIDNNIKILIPN